MKKTLFATVSILLMLFAFVACDGEPTRPSDGPAKTDVIASVNDILTAIFGDIGTELVTKEDGTWKTDEYSGSYTFTVSEEDGKSWTLDASGDSIPAAKATEAEIHDIEVTLAFDGEKYTDFSVQLEGEPFTEITESDVEDAMEGITPPGSENEEDKPFAWDISVRIAKHNEKNGFNDHDNYKYAEVEPNNDGSFTVKAALNRLVSYGSTDESRGEGKWIALLIGTGAEDITKLSYNSSALGTNDVNERNDMLGSNNSAVASDEFVLWINADKAKDISFKLSYNDKSAEVEDKTVTIKLEDWANCDVKDAITVHARAANHTQEFDGSTNGEHITLDVSGDASTGYTIAIEADEDKMTAFTSTDSTQAEKKDVHWFPILISTGITDIKNVYYGSSKLTDNDITERDQMIGVDGLEPASDEFVLWLYTEDQSLGPSGNFTRKLALSENEESSVFITITLEKTSSASEATEEDN